jgi:hypothetical protein
MARRPQREERRGGGAGFAIGIEFVGDDEAVAQDDAAAGIVGEHGVVGDEDEGGAFDAVEFEQKLENVSAVGGVEVAGGLVGEHDGRVQDEGAGEGDALLLAAGELDGVMIHAVTEADAGEELAGAREAIAGGVEFVREEDVFERGERGDELIGLEDEADGLAADLGELVLGEIADCGPVEMDVAGGGRVKAGEEAQERGLAAAGRAHDGDELAPGDGEVEALEDVYGARAVANRLAQSVDDDHWLRCACVFTHGFKLSLAPADKPHELPTLIRWNDAESLLLSRF